MRCESKRESVALIKRLGLNTVLAVLVDDSTPFERFIHAREIVWEHSDLKKWHVRHMSPGGRFVYGVNPWEIPLLVQEYEAAMIGESLVDADAEHLLLQGEIVVDAEMQMLASLNQQRGKSNREAMGNPPIKIVADLLERREPPVQGLAQVVDFYFEHGLFGMVMEFTLFDVPVGIRREPLVVWELRNY